MYRSVWRPLGAFLSPLIVLGGLLLVVVGGTPLCSELVPTRELS